MRLWLAPIFLVIMFLISISVGQYSISIAELWHSLTNIAQGHDLTDHDIVLWHIRMPRMLTAMVVGSALAIAGATYQGMFRNPLVSPDILGVSAGSGLGAVTAIYFGFSVVGIQVVAFLFGLATVALVYLISQMVRRLDPILALVLSGIAISALLGAGISLVKLLSDPYSQLTLITFWLMGSLTMATLEDLYIVVPLFIISFMPLFLLRWRMNLLSLDDEEVLALGVNVQYLRLIFILSATLMTSAVVSISGVIGWIGLVIPHIARLWVGPDFRRLLPTALFMGAGFLLLTDTLARTIFPIEMPLSILTAFIGAPFFIGLLLKGGAH
ncbi:iron ABC transporter permease [Ignatzschineria ureiclastica]|uniref:Iron ABC transporter permease n=1 Tax=Ignatzschineria ureiclastica TaxID=472582 RepID=A0A2U2AE63_9GAMM|nr:iron ABC transporter permease [Ignatzschineria ureiclastica]PWD80952.1 iron ABC transporter permease [Ignatzschineria ureiclastica]GGZ93676.1 ABC transporter permease [Ignatzschineria ureiclastica]